MNVLFAIGNGYLPQFHGGVQSSTHHLIAQLAAGGHSASVLASLFGDGLFGLRARVKMKLLGQPAVVDRFPGYPVVRAWFPWEAVPFALEQARPDVAVVQCHKSVPLGKALEAAGVPIVVYLRNVEFDELDGDPRELRSALYIANSQFTADTYKRVFGIELAVIPPSIDRKSYATESSKAFVTFINPYPVKGLQRAADIARACPDIPFLFVESWKLDGERLVAAQSAIDGLANVTMMPRTDDMRSVYGQTKILLAPSQWEEAWGRVASEAHCSGIPVVGSRRGGLPEAIGEGGIVLDHDTPLTDWVDAVRRLWDDERHYISMSERARQFSLRPALDPTRQFAAFLAVLEQARAGNPLAHAA